MLALVALAVAGGLAAAAAVLEARDDPAAAAAPPDPAATARTFLAAWQVGDYRTMYALTTAADRSRIRYRRFAAAYRAAAATAGMRGLHPVGPVRAARDAATATMAVSLHVIGRVRLPLRLPLVAGTHRDQVAWSPNLVFPGLAPGERLSRRVRVPSGRGQILARDRTPLATGPAPDRQYPAGSAFSLVTGYVGPPQGPAAVSRRRDGWPAKRPYGQGGLEKSLDPLLAGRPRVSLFAVAPGGSRRVLARRPGRKPRDVVTTLEVGMQDAAVAALGGLYGGVVVLDPRTGQVLADAGLGMDAVQPPGSSFKTVTASAALAGHKATLTSTYPYARSVVLDGWNLHNFHHELCGGTLLVAFAVSCNSVFAPLADTVGAGPLVRMATAFGFNRPPTIAYPVPESRTRSAAAMSSDLSLGVAGIGQGGVLASPLQMASVAQTIGSGGLRRPPYLIRYPRSLRDQVKARRVIPRAVATQVRTLMEAVVTEGTGTAAAIPGVTVAGKTGTAEVGVGRKSDAWFIAFAPAEAPRVAVAVLVVNGGVGGEVAAPIARRVLEAALAR